MNKRAFKLTIGIKSKEAPTFMDGEAPGVFVVKEFEVPAGESDVSMARWAIDKEDEMVAECVELKWEELT